MEGEELMMYSDFYDNSLVNSPSIDTTWMIVSVVLAIVGGLAIYAVFVAKKNEDDYTGFLKWMHSFLNFKTFFVEAILKVLYLISALFVTLSSFSYISVSIASFFVTLIFGNLALRIAYELLLMMITLVNNTTEINRKLGSQPKTVATKTKKKSEDDTE